MFRRTYWFIIIDFLTAFFGWNLFFYLRKSAFSESIKYDVSSIYSGLIIALVWVLIFFLSSRYRDLYHKSRVAELIATFRTVIVTSVLFFFILFLDDEGVKHYKDYYKIISLFISIHIVLFILVKAITLSFAKRLVIQKKVQFNTLIIGSNKRSIDFINQIEEANKTLGLNFLGYIHIKDENADYLSSNLRHWGGIGQLRTVIRRCKVSQIIISLDPSEYEKITYLLSIINTNDIKVSLIPDTYHLLLGTVQVNHILGVPIIDIKQELMPLWQRITKRGIDIAISFLALLIGSPMYFLFMILTKTSSPGPIFYSQLRVGKNENLFKIYKFRSMYVGSEKAGPALSSDNDSRITPWGRVMRKLRIDELPQFYNVLIGDMSLVGTRPEREHFIEQIITQAPHYKRLLQLRPGITSLGQVKFGYAENVNEMVRRMEYDIAYLDNISLTMDFRIMLATVMVVIEGRGK